jgi:hypothetical protein
MRKLVLILAMLAMLSAMVVMVSADEETMTGAGESQDNACNEGGVMYGKCDSEWAWKGGWYLARFLTGEFTREQVPDEFQILLPPPPPPPPASAGSAPARVVTICANWNSYYYCLSSDQTGTGDINGTPHEIYMMVDGACPATYQGKNLAYSFGSNWWTDVVTPNFASLNLMPTTCLYFV